MLTKNGSTQCFPYKSEKTFTLPLINRKGDNLCGATICRIASPDNPLAHKVCLSATRHEDWESLCNNEAFPDEAATITMEAEGTELASLWIIKEQYRKCLG